MTGPTRLSDMLPKTPAGGNTGEGDGAFAPPPDHPEWGCPVCHGAGMVDTSDDWVPGTRGRLRLEPCPACDVGRKARERYLRSLDGMSDEQRLMTFGNYDPNPNAAALHAVRWAAQLRHGLVILVGGFGRGKTHLLSAGVNAVRDDPQHPGLAAYVTMPELMERIKRGLDKHEDVVSRYVDLPVLALDEFGRQHMSDWGQAQVFRIVDGRYLMTRTALTLVASNDEPSEWPDYIRSRFTDRRAQVIHMVGGDVRQRMEWA